MGFWDTWKAVMFEPMEFFQKMPKKVSISDASKYYLKIHAMLLGALAVVGLFFVAVFSTIFSIFGNEGLLLGGAFFGIYALVILIGIPIMLLLSWGFMFVGAGLLHIMAGMFGSKEKYTESVKIVSYASTPNLLAFVPFVNYVVGIYSIVLQVMGTHKRHKLSIGKSIAVVLIPFGLYWALAMMIYIPLIVFANIV
jgi:hypothetical protein